MPLNRRSATKLASLSAVGAGALALTAGRADAGIIYSGTINLTVGCGCGPVSDLLVGPSQAAALFMYPASTYTTVGTNLYQTFRAVKVGGFGVSLGSSAIPARFRFQKTPSPLSASLAPPQFAKLFAEGAVWPGSGPTYTAYGTGAWPPSGSVPSYYWGLAVAHRRVSVTFSSATTGTPGQSYPAPPANPANHFLLFAFTSPTCPGGACYGWMDLEISMDPEGPSVTLRSWAYDDSGAYLPAGAGAVPEPSTFAMTGLAALALGAKGIRRWRAKRAS